MRVLCILFHEPQEKICELAEVFYQITPDIGLRKNEALFLEVKRCQRLYNDKTLLLRVLALLKRWGVSAQLSLAPDPATALAFCHFYSDSVYAKRLESLPLTALSFFYDPFKLEKDHRDTQRHIQILIRDLKKLGLKTLQDFLTLPASEVSTHFGSLALKLWESTKGLTFWAWPTFRPEDKVVENVESLPDEGIEGLETLIFVLKPRIDRLLLRLRGRHQKLLKLRLKVCFERSSLLKTQERIWDFVFHFPLGTARDVLRIVHEKIKWDVERDPLMSAIESIELEVIEAVSSLEEQKDLFDPQREEQIEQWNSIMSRLVMKLGLDRVFLAQPLAEYKPEKAWVKVLEPKILESKNKEDSWNERFPQRPTRLLKEPISVQWIQNRLHFDGITAKVLKWEGPEILSGEWWDEGFERRYYKVFTDTGEVLWIYRSDDEVISSDEVTKRNKVKIYLHGFFD